MWENLAAQDEPAFKFHFPDDIDDDPFSKWDSFSPASADEDCGLAEALSDPFLPSKPLIYRNRAVQPPMKLVSVGLSDPATSHVATLPVKQTPRVFSSQSPHPRPVFPKAVPPDVGLSNYTFDFACRDANLHFNARALGFLPEAVWPDEETTFGDVVYRFFQRKNNANCRFSHKLFNALKLAELNQVYSELTGLYWLNDIILRVDKRSFARLLGIQSVEGALFHQQGNFPSHGFFEIGSGDREQYCPPDLDLTGVDFHNVRLLFHTENQFRRGCTGHDIEQCRWANNRRGPDSPAP
jgi:hypothetical protein